jgi:hypothetical protein
MIRSTARTPHREALENAWTAARCVEHEDAAGRFDSRDYYIRVAMMWAQIAQAEKRETPSLAALSAMIPKEKT